MLARAGVLLDLGRGHHLSIDIARKMMPKGVIPDIISSDVHGTFGSFNDASTLDYSLFGTLSLFLALGMTLPELIEALPDAPRHVLVNMVPMHPSRSFFTLQNLGVATCPYRIAAVPEFVEAMQALGYEVVDRWESFERQLRIPFNPDTVVDRYYGFYFRRSDAVGDHARK